MWDVSVPRVPLLLQAAHLRPDTQSIRMASVVQNFATLKAPRVKSACSVRLVSTIDGALGLRKSCCHDSRTVVLGLVVPLRD